MDSAEASEAAAAMAGDLQAAGAGSLQGLEEGINDNVLSNLLSASCPTPLFVNERYGRYPWTTLGGFSVE